MKSSLTRYMFLACLLAVVGLSSGNVGPALGAVESSPSTVSSQSWEEDYVKAARITIEKGVMSVMNGVRSPEELQAAVEQLHRHWAGWADSRLFILEDDRDIDVYGNLYSLQVLCRTMRLAAEDWYEAEKSDRAEATLEKALWLEKESRLLAEPVAQIIMRQSYSQYLPRRVEIMKEQFPYVDEFYGLHSFQKVLQETEGLS